MWATTEFNDSLWEDVDLTPNESTRDPITGLPGFVPGWTARGHRGYSGYAWYRIRLRLEPPIPKRLALAGPSVVDDGYQVFDNGKLIGSFGDFSQSTPSTGVTQPRTFRLPQDLNESSDVTIVLAFRVWMHPATLLLEPGTGGFHTAPTLGEADAIASNNQQTWVTFIRGAAINPIAAILFGGVTVMAFSLIFFDSSDRVYLWIGGVLCFLAIYRIFLCFSLWTELSGLAFNLGAALLSSLIYAGWVMVWWVWFGKHKPTWMPALACGLAFIIAITYTIGLEQFFFFIPHSVAVAFHAAGIIFRLLFTALLLGIVIQGIKRVGLDGWLVLPAVILLGIASFAQELTYLGVFSSWSPFGIDIGLGDLSDLLLVAVVTLLLLLRLKLSIVRQREIALDVKQAQEVQHVLLPESIHVPGLKIETEYRPAREVGGDFFQILPQGDDGSVLIVAGDVTGKGLQAGMLVALLVGAIRSTAEYNADPQFVLEALNRRLLGRGEAHATCLALHIESNGAVKLANAGHLPPYLNGVEVDMAGALPLGMVASAEFPVSHFQLNPGDNLTLISDGILEAQDKTGQLFGFDRIRELLRKRPSAAEIATEAQNFGQEDDLSVVVVTTS